MLFLLLAVIVGFADAVVVVVDVAVINVDEIFWFPVLTHSDGMTMTYPSHISMLIFMPTCKREGKLLRFLSFNGRNFTVP